MIDARSCCLLVVLMLSTPSTAKAQGRDEARAHFNEGLALVDAERYEEAAAQFELAYALKPNAAVLYNIAKAQAAARRLASAARSFERYLESAERIPDTRRREVMTELAALEPRLGRLALTTIPADAEVRVDGRVVVGGAQWVDPGRRLVSIVAAGHVSIEREVLVATGQITELELRLERLPEPKLAAAVARAPIVTLETARPAPARLPVAVDSAPNAQRLWFAASTAGAGLVLAAATVGLVVDNAARHDRWQREQDELDARWRNPADDPSARQAQNDERANRIKLQDQIATGTAVASAACLVASVLIWIVVDERRTVSRPRAAALSPSGDGARLSVTW